MAERAERTFPVTGGTDRDWETLKGMVGLMKTDYELGDLSFEKVNGDIPWQFEDHSC